MIILSLDIATRTGWACGSSGARVPEFGICQMTKGGEDLGKPLAEFELWLTKTMYEKKPDLVVFECPVMPATTGIAVLRRLYGLAGLAEKVVYSLGIECAEEHLQSIKKFVTGSGRAEKREVVRAVNTMFGLDLNSGQDNEADAIALWALACHKRDEKNARRFDLGALGMAAR